MPGVNFYSHERHEFTRIKKRLVKIRVISGKILFLDSCQKDFVKILFISSNLK